MQVAQYLPTDLPHMKPEGLNLPLSCEKRAKSAYIVQLFALSNASYRCNRGLVTTPLRSDVISNHDDDMNT